MLHNAGIKNHVYGTLSSTSEESSKPSVTSYRRGLQPQVQKLHKSKTRADSELPPHALHTAPAWPLLRMLHTCKMIIKCSISATHYAKL